MSSVINDFNISKNSAGAIALHRRVTVNSSGNLVLASATQPGIGSSRSACDAANEPITVKTRSGGGTHVLTSAKAITAGSNVYGAAAGKVTDSPSGGAVYLGIATSTVAAADQNVEVVMADAVQPSVFNVRKSPSSGEDAANSMDVDTGFGVAPAGAVLVTLQNSAGLSRPCTYTLLGGGSAGVIRIAEANLATTDVVNVVAYLS